MIKLKSLLSEVMFSANFWMLPDGKIIKVDDHIHWFMKNVKTKDIYIDKIQKTPVLKNGSVAEPEDVYKIASKMGYIRMLKPYGDEYPLNVDAEEFYYNPPTNLQLRNIRNFAIENGWKLKGISED